MNLQAAVATVLYSYIIQILFSRHLWVKRTLAAARTAPEPVFVIEYNRQNPRTIYAVDKTGVTCI